MERVQTASPEGLCRREVRREELPFCCPPPGSELWSAHPRVYLPLGEQAHARCPYCGTLFVLKE